MGKFTGKKQAIIQSLENNLFNVSLACKEVKISRDTYYKWLKKYSKFKKEIDNIQESQIDFVESKLFENIKKGKEKSIIFYLKTKGKSRGYNDTGEQHSNEMSVSEYFQNIKEAQEKRRGRYFTDRVNKRLEGSSGS